MGLTREEAKEKCEQYVEVEPRGAIDLRRFLDKIYDDFDEQLKEMYIKGGDDCFKALKENGKLKGE